MFQENVQKISIFIIKHKSPDFIFNKVTKVKGLIWTDMNWYELIKPRWNDKNWYELTLTDTNWYELIKTRWTDKKWYELTLTDTNW